jgi:oxygen-independent coproporphyrinogen-3 oxidase
MKKELKIRDGEVQKPLESIYFGGGSPSLIPPKELNLLLEDIHKTFPISNKLEITVEVNPDDVEKNYLEELLLAGVNRLSLGVQSFFDQDLKLMNRVHSAQQSENALGMVAKYFANYTLDLIYGMPYSTLESWDQNLIKAMQYNPPHLSAYALTVEEKTVLHYAVKNQKILMITEEEVQDQYNLLTQRMSLLKYVNYEFSNFGKTGFFSVNNQNYWNGMPYIGIGPSAHSFDGVSIRSWNISNNHLYTKALNQGELNFEKEVLTTKDRYNEYIMTGLRKLEGLSLDYVNTHFGSIYGQYLEDQVNRQLESRNLYWDGNSLKIHQHAKFLTDGIAADLFKI